MPQSALPVARKKVALAKLRCRSCTQAHTDVLSTVMVCCALVCFSHWCDVIFTVWSVNLDSYDSWSLWKLRSLLGAGLTYLITDTLGLQALAFNHHLQWLHVRWNLIIVLRTEWPTSWESLPRVRGCRRLPWHSHDKVFTSVDSNTAVKKTVQIFPTGESLRWRKSAQSEDAITYKCQIWPWHGIWT